MFKRNTIQRDTKVVPLNNDSFSKSLYKNSNLLRIVLHRPIENNIQLNKWYRIDLKLVTEMGLLMDQHLNLIKLTCNLLVANKFSCHHQIESRPITQDTWDPEAAKSQGFRPYKSIGGVEYRINSSQNLQNAFYITLASTMQVTPILSLTVGPIYIENKSISKEKWCNAFDRNNLQEQQQYRALQSSLSNSTYFLLKEQWNFGTPGKIWDSAIVMTSLLLKIFAIDATHLSNKRVLDLSAGTGYIGLSIAQCYQNTINPPCVILTDLEEALDLIEQNRKLNHINQSSHLIIQPLTWGNKEEANHITRNGTIDIVIASDVLYNVVHFPSLIATLRHLCGQSTIIYLCYKQRGLTLNEEKSFFKLCKRYFHVEQLDTIEQQQLASFERTTAVRIYKLKLQSLPLWSQLLLKPKK